MRTTVELPPELMRAAKARAAQQGESLKHWFARAVAIALGQHPHTASVTPRTWPVFGRPGGKTVNLTNADIANLEAADDLERHRHLTRRSAK